MKSINKTLDIKLTIRESLADSAILHFFCKEGAKKGITLCLHKSNQKAQFFGTPRPKKEPVVQPLI